MLDDAIIQLPSTTLVAPDVSLPNHAYSYRLWVDRLIRAWIFAMISKERFFEVCNISHVLPIW